MHFDRFFRLSERRGDGVFCGMEGVFIAGVPLLEESDGGGGRVEWRVRSRPDLETRLSKSYGVGVDFGAKMEGAAAIARALTDGDLARAQIATLLLGLPDPPPLLKSGEASLSHSAEFARLLSVSGLLKGDWDPGKHPRWPAGSADATGGQFAPADSDEATDEARAMVIPAQIAIPLDVPETVPFPLPSEIVPPLTTPILPQNVPQNPYPSRPECVKEWADAEAYCRDLQTRGLLGRGDYRWMGKTLTQCVMGQVSEDCGGNPTT